MRLRKISPVLVPTMFCAGCSVYPLPQDTTGLQTKKIVANIRCEARDAVRQAIKYYLIQYDNPITKDGLTGIQLIEKLKKSNGRRVSSR